MSNVLIVAEAHGGSLRKAALHAVAAGRALAARTGGKLHVALLGAGVAPLGPELAKHAAEVHVADAPVLEKPLAEAHAPVIAALAKAVGATWVGAAATAYGKDVLPRAAALLEAGNSVGRTVNTFTAEAISTSARTFPAHIGRRKVTCAPSPPKARTSVAMPAPRSAAARGRRSFPYAVAAAPT